MDPVSQGVVAAIAAQSVSADRVDVRKAAFFGWFAGMVADLDVLLRSSTDPLRGLEFHRQFTHSLFFIPFGGAICAIVFFWLFGRRWQVPLRSVLLWCVIGYATHGLLDACTNYGTQLYWPFSNAREAFNTISIIDPLWTLPLLALMGFGCWRQHKVFAIAGLIWMVLYMGVGIVQRERAEAVGLQLAQSRGHEPVRLEAKPSLGNLLIWKLVYSTEDRYFVDAIRLGLSPLIYQGESVEILNVARDFPWLDSRSQQAKDIERFRWFSNDYLAMSPYHAGRIIDVRYSALPHEIRGLWGVTLDQKASVTDHVTWVVDRDPNKARFDQLWSMILGRVEH